jgi:hypothetical protein
MSAMHNNSHANCNYLVQINKASGFSKAAESHRAYIQENPPKSAHLFLGAACAHDRHEFGAGGRALAGVTDRGTAVNIQTYDMGTEKVTTLK